MSEIELISQMLSIRDWQVRNTLSLIDSDNTVHFIARYRKEMTGDLDENQIRMIVESRDRMVALAKAKDSALRSIEEQGKLTPELKKEIEQADNMARLEDIYAPYKRKRKTKADLAREKGFQPVAAQIRRQEMLLIPEELLKKFSREEIIAGAKDIVIQDLTDDPSLRDEVRKHYSMHGFISADTKDIEKLDEKQKAEQHKFIVYESFYRPLSRLKSYQVLALNRGEKLGILDVKLDKSKEYYEMFRTRILARKTDTGHIDECIKNAYNRIFDSIETELRNRMTETASADAVVVFQENLRKLLMLRPHYEETVLAIDPGQRTGCKICLLDRQGRPLRFSKFYLEDKEKALRTVKELIADVDTIVLGNGTGSAEANELLRGLGKRIVVVNESGASVYSASDAGREEFPQLDATDRGTVSIGRRYIDCLSELVKIPVLSIGVGMYQHDMPEKELQKKLSEVIEDAVNLVGINVNVASTYLLSYVSGLDKRSAKKISDNRPYRTRKDLTKILSKKTYQQSVGFLRIPDSPEPLDNTAVHPEQYEAMSLLLKHITEADIFGNHEEELKAIYPGITRAVVDDMLKNYREAGRELRILEGNLSLEWMVRLEALKEGDIVNGIVRNVMPFGAFVDIGAKNNGLVHISQLADYFVRNPHDIVQVGEEVTVKVIGIDLQHGKLQLSMKSV